MFSVLLFVASVVYVFLLPLPEFSRPTYISENALMPDYVWVVDSTKS